ncbi:MAG: hypothetical protein MUP62_04010, partial [Dehalococcoidia bacterium]|nr:hypothetical protein [Dehalococcoidia bacterium]
MWASACARGGVAGAHGGEPISSHSFANPLTRANFTPSISRFSFLWALILGCLALAACQGTEPSAQPSPTASPTATLNPTATPSPTAMASLVSGDQAYHHLLVLAQDIGSRPAGSEAERQAAQYNSQQLTIYGYQTQMQE